MIISFIWQFCNILFDSFAEINLTNLCYIAWQMCGCISAGSSLRTMRRDRVSGTGLHGSVPFFALLYPWVNLSTPCTQLYPNKMSTVFGYGWAAGQNRRNPCKIRNLLITSLYPTVCSSYHIVRTNCTKDPTMNSSDAPNCSHIFRWFYS